MMTVTWIDKRGRGTITGQSVTDETGGASSGRYFGEEASGLTPGRYFGDSPHGTAEAVPRGQSPCTDGSGCLDEAGGVLAKLGPKTEIIAPENGGAVIAPETERLMAAMAEQMARMAQAMEETRERMAELEAAVRTLEKVTPGQAAEINRRIRERAAEICGDWRMDGCEKLVAGWIRKTVRERTGVNTAREIPRCDFGSVCGMIAAWEDVALIRGARKRMKEAGAS